LLKSCPAALAGFSREEVTVKVDDGFLIVATATKPAAVDGAQPLQVQPSRWL
jgi:HSP20 family molecular chaperone IbpA